MGLRVVGAGLGRTGTASLKLALERLLGKRCYHMTELLEHKEHLPAWQRAVTGEPVDWEALFDDYAATVDWPGAAFWSELSTVYPDAIVLLSTRADAETWWRSAKDTILTPAPAGIPRDRWLVSGARMFVGLMRTRHSGLFVDNAQDRAAAIGVYERHNAWVRSAVPAGRLVEWQPGDGWAPLCDALHLPVPDEPFPHANTTAAYRAGLDSFHARMSQPAAMA